MSSPAVAFILAFAVAAIVCKPLLYVSNAASIQLQLKASGRDKEATDVPRLAHDRIELEETRPKRRTFTRMLWPNATVPYLLTDSLSQKAIDAVQWAIGEWESKTCIHFARLSLADNDLQSKPHLQIMSDKLCHSQIGLQVNTGPQSLTIGPGCEEAAIALHELGHAIGLYHEHSREDRDQYIDIIWDNIDSIHIDQFAKYPRGVVDSFGVPYDVHSVMHYPAYAYSVNGNATITAKDGNTEIGNAGILTQLDAELINRLYNCSSQKHVSCLSNETCLNGGFFNDRACQCSCLPYWTDVSCQTCGLVCENGGTPTDDCSECICAVGYAGTLCEECSFSCTNGGQPNGDCTACKNCSTGSFSQTLVDQSSYCKHWVAKGYCNPFHAYYDFMRRYCARSCNCGICQDMTKNGDCEKFKNRGFCSKVGTHFDYMKKECIMTCGWC